jgi:hypothetical protein
MLTIGPMYSLPLGRKTAMDLKTMVGWMGTVEVTDSYANDLSAGDAIALDVRATLRYDLFRRWAVFAEGGVAAANVKLRDGTPKPVSSLISGLGVAFRPAW